MDRHTIAKIMDYLSSSDSDDDDDEIIKYFMSRKIKIIPKIKSYISDIVHVYTDKQVSSLL